MFQGRDYEPAARTEMLIVEGWAAPAAPGMHTDQLIHDLVAQGFMDERQAPKKVSVPWRNGIIR